MATTKKKPVSKAATTKVATKKATKTPAARKASPKKTVVEHRSFRPSQEKTPFMTFQLTIQSVYWMILSALVLALGAWVMHLNVQIQEIYDQVEINTQLNEAYVAPAAEKAKSDTVKP